jgi:hypothetical protein
LVLRIKIINLHSTIKIVTNAFKENKIRNKGIDIFGQENQTPYCCYCKSENISVKFLKVFYYFCVIPFLGAKKGKGGGYYLIKDPKEIMAHVYRILRSDSIIALCQSQFL